MFVFVLNKHSEPLMPTNPAKARKLLKHGKAKVVRRAPFTIKLLHGSSGYKQTVVAGMDAGSKVVGSAAVTNGKVIYQAEVAIRQDVSKKMQQRAMYRRTRRGRKCRYRPARWLNRANSRREGRLPPSLQSKLQSHLRERHFIESILPVTRWNVETAQFDIHKITNPDVSGADYQRGEQQGFYNVKSYILHRDGYKCCSGRKCKHSDKLHVHHILFRSQGGGDQPRNLITLCETCHNDLHAGKYELKKKANTAKHPTQMGIVSARLEKSDWDFQVCFGYDTKFKREQILGLPKTHANDAVAICLEHGEWAEPLSTMLQKKHVSAGDYQQTKGRRSEIRIPTGKLFGLRKFDLVSTQKGTGRIKGKRSTGYFSVEGVCNSVNVKKGVRRISARTTTLTNMALLLPLKEEVSEPRRIR